MRTRLLVAAAAGYLIGCIPVARTVARRHGVDDLRTVGDRNPGAWNTMELLGGRAALPVFVGDTAKGAIAAAAGLAAAPGVWWAPYATGGAAMAGHAFPVTDGCRGGRSVLAFVGVGLVAAPRPAAIAVAIAGATLVTTRRLDVAARVGVFGFPLVQMVSEGPRRTAATGVLMSFVGLRFAQATIGAAPGDGDPAT
ncbi:MAG: glycerol-3-phosphate acyltransferase [Ilumatobacter sp.]|nr:glycerol-3-phosphate acyltransferase [Ilumatobacter sp.]